MSRCHNTYVSAFAVVGHRQAEPEIIARVLTIAEAQQAFVSVAARAQEIPFRWLAEGCECRAQVMIEHLQAVGYEPGRVWAVSVGRPLAAPNPDNPRQTYKWNSHVAATVRVEQAEHEVMVIDPSLSDSGAVTIGEWATAMSATTIEVSRAGLSEEMILNLQAERMLQGSNLDAVLFILSLGEPPV
jgi:hypothetical protein